MVYLIVGIGGILGALSRYYVGAVLNIWWQEPFPISTLLINLVGCFLLSWLMQFVAKATIVHPYLITGLGTGFVGSFTTFSTFSVETIQLIQSSQWGLAFLYVWCSLVGGLFLAWLGYRVGDYFYKRHTVGGETQ